MENYDDINVGSISEYHSNSTLSDNAECTNNMTIFTKRNPPVTKPIFSVSSENETLCRVCSDISTGKHYGQISCEGCKSFFKRSIRRKDKYICKNHGKCKIYKELRNQCQACRFMKCQQIGMKKDSVQTVRSSKSGTPGRKESYSCKSEPTTKKPIDIESNKNWKEQLIININLSNKTALNSVLQAENAAPIHCVDDFVDQSMSIVCSIAAWSKELIFSEQFDETDKLLLLKNSWCQLFLLNYSLCGLSSKLIYNRNSPSNSFNLVQNQLLALNRLPMDAVECGCLKAIIYFNPDTNLLFNCSLVDKAQKIFQAALESHVTHSCTDKNRFGRLLLRLPYLKEISTSQILEVFFNNDNEDYANFINEVFQRLITTSKSNVGDDFAEDI